MNARCAASLLITLCLLPAAATADVFDDAAFHVAGDYWLATLEYSETTEEAAAALGAYGIAGHAAGADGGYTILEGYAELVGVFRDVQARLADDEPDDPWYSAPFAWLKENAQVVPELVARVTSSLKLDHIMLANYLLSAHDTIMGQPDWEQKFTQIKQDYAAYAVLDADENLDWEVKTAWLEEHRFVMTLGSNLYGQLTPQQQERVAWAMPDYVAWGLAKDWLGAHVYPSVTGVFNEDSILIYSSVSFENYLASFWYRRWDDGTLDVAYQALKLVSAVMPRDFARQAALGHGFADTIPASSTRTGADWEIHPTPSAVVTYTLVGEDGKTPLAAPVTKAVPVAQPAATFAPDVEGYSYTDWETLTPAREGESATMVLTLRRQ